MAAAKPMKAASAPPIHWADEPAAHDYPAAVAFLSLLTSATVAQGLSRSLSLAPTTHQKAKDILRAARVPVLPVDDVEVAKALAKAAAGTPLSPILLIQGDLATGLPLTIADGYHRTCAAYHLGDDTDIPCRMVTSGVSSPSRA